MRRVSSLRSTKDCLSVSGLLYITVLFYDTFLSLIASMKNCASVPNYHESFFRSNLFHRRPRFDPAVGESVQDFVTNLSPLFVLFFHSFKRLPWIMEIRRLTSAAIKLSRDLHRKNI